MNKDRFHSIHSIIPSATPKVGQPHITFPFYTPPTPVEHLQDEILREHRQQVHNTNWGIRSSTFSVQQFIHQRSISGTTYYQHCCQAYQRKQHRLISAQYTEVLNRETIRKANTISKINAQKYLSFTPNQYIYLVKLRDTARAKKINK